MELKLTFLSLAMCCCCYTIVHGQDSYYSFYRSRSNRFQAKPQPQIVMTSHSKPGYLDPMNFRLPDITLNNLQTILREIEMHIRPKQNNIEFYSGARLLILLLQEECFKLRTSGNPQVLTFCNSFRNRYRSFF